MHKNEHNSAVTAMLTAILAVFGSIMTVVLLAVLLLQSQDARQEKQTAVPDQQIMEKFDSFMSDIVSDAREAVTSVPIIFEIESDEEVPKPDVSGYGTAEDPAQLQGLLDAASYLLNGQQTHFTTETPVQEGTEITYYLDETIFAVSWQQVIDNMIYTIAEVKVAHPSQFRRYMADGDFDSKNLYTTTQLSEQAGAVLAGSGDYFKSREAGIVVYEGKVERCYGAKQLDTCFVDVNGDLILMPKGSFTDAASVQAFVDENNISFSFAFGPLLVDDGVQCEPENYGLGEANGYYARAAICQRDELHYLMVVCNGSDVYRNYPNIHMFAEQIAALGCEKAYALDGGQTGAIVMQHELLNPTEYTNGQRRIGDMYFFATAIPE